MTINKNFMSDFDKIDKETTKIATRLWNLGAHHSIDKEKYSDYVEIWKEISLNDEDFGATVLLKLAQMIDVYTSHVSILSEIIEVRKGKHGIVEITSVQQPERYDGKPIEIDLVARREKLKYTYEIIVNPKTRERKPLRT